MRAGVLGAAIAGRFESIDPALALAATAWASARALGLSPHDADRVAATIVDDVTAAATLATRLENESLGGTGVLGVVHELSCTPPDRKARGVHYTPVDLAVRLATATLAGGTSTQSVCDPACGGGAFLVASAASLAELGGDPRAIVSHQLFGADLDPLATAVTRVELALWAARETGILTFVPSGHVTVGDSLIGGSEQWSEAPVGGFDVIIGNPPFGSQLRRRTARSVEQGRARARLLGLRATGYADEAGLFLVAASDLVTQGGLVTLVLPRSLMSSRDASQIRALVEERCTLQWMWVGQGDEFSAGVQVWAPCFIRRAAPDDHQQQVPRTLGPELADAGSVVHRRSSRTWGHLVADLFDGVAFDDAEFASLTGQTLGTIASLTAGFRTQFYGLAPHTASTTGTLADGVHALVTSGAIDPLHNRWGHATARFAGNDLTCPAVDLDAVRAENPALADWVTARLVPKVLVAPQSAIIEAALDSAGTWVPSTPVISVEPHDRSDRTAALAAAALSSPIAAAWARYHAAGTGLSSRTMRLSARLLTGLPLPTDLEAWQRGAVLANDAQRAAARGDGAAWSAALGDLGSVMTVAYGMAPTHPVVAWWCAMRPVWR